MARRGAESAEAAKVALGNPFRLLPALKFGAVFTVILFAGRAAASAFGSRGLLWTSAAGGGLDADAVVVSVSALLGRGEVPISTGVVAIALALAANAMVKSGIALYVGPVSYAARVAAGFIVMFGAGALAWMMFPGA